MDAAHGSNVDATLRELASLPDDLRESATARLALEMALQLDSKTSGAQKALCGARLQEALEALRERLPPVREVGRYDALAKRRAASAPRRAGA